MLRAHTTVVVRPSIVPVARYSACEIAWHRWGQIVVLVVTYAE